MSQQTWDAPPLAVLSAPFSPAHFAFVQVGCAMAFADNTWGEADLYPVLNYFGLDWQPDWHGQEIPERAFSKRCALRVLEILMESPSATDELKERARRLEWYFR